MSSSSSRRSSSQTPDLFFFFNDTATTEIYTLSLHDALPISLPSRSLTNASFVPSGDHAGQSSVAALRSEEHTSELQSRLHLVCRLLLEKKKPAPTKPLIRPWARRGRALSALSRTGR